MDLRPSPKAREYADRVAEFISTRIEPVEPAYQQALKAGDDDALKLIDDLKAKARKAGLWNLFMPDPRHGPGFGNVDYAPIAELTGRCLIAPEV
ncbi:MAG: acyl-CoA dehydrogenase, partial [Micromonosporaceae bacterium]